MAIGEGAVDPQARGRIEKLENTIEALQNEIEELKKVHGERLDMHRKEINRLNR